MTVTTTRRPKHLTLGVVAIATLAAGCGSATSKPAASSPASKQGPPTVSTIPAAPPTGAAPTSPVGIAAPTPWPAALHDSAHSSSSIAVGPVTAAIRWTRNLGAPVTAGAVVGADGTIYESANNGILHALDPNTGADKWIYNGGGSSDNGQDLSTSPALLANGTIVWPGPNSTLDALDATGKLLWQQKMTGTVLSPAVTTGDKVYVADSKGDVHRRFSHRSVALGGS